MRHVSIILTRRRMVYGRFLALDCGSPEPLAVFKAENDRVGGGGTVSDSKLSMPFIAFRISESCSRRSGTGLSTASSWVKSQHLLVSFSSRDGNRSEWAFTWELTEVEGSLWRGRGVKSWLNSFDRDSTKRDENERRRASKFRLTICERRNILDVDVKVRIFKPLAESVESVGADRLIGLYGSSVIRLEIATENCDVLEAFSSSSSLTLFLCLDFPRSSLTRNTRGLAESTSLRSMLFLRPMRGFWGVSSLRARVNSCLRDSW